MIEAPTKLLLNSAEAAQALGISERTLWSLTASGEIPVVRVRRSVRYAVDSLREWIESQERQGGSKA